MRRIRWLTVWALVLWVWRNRVELGEWWRFTQTLPTRLRAGERQELVREARRRAGSSMSAAAQRRRSK
jgi:hypothetical protein